MDELTIAHAISIVSVCGVIIAAIFKAPWPQKKNGNGNGNGKYSQEMCNLKHEFIDKQHRELCDNIAEFKKTNGENFKQLFQKVDDLNTAISELRGRENKTR